MNSSIAQYEPMFELITIQERIQQQENTILSQSSGNRSDESTVPTAKLVRLTMGGSTCIGCGLAM